MYWFYEIFVASHDAGRRRHYEWQRQSDLIAWRARAARAEVTAAAFAWIGRSIRSGIARLATVPAYIRRQRPNRVAG